MPKVIGELVDGQLLVLMTKCEFNDLNRSIVIEQNAYEILQKLGRRLKQKKMHKFTRPIRILCHRNIEKEWDIEKNERVVLGGVLTELDETGLKNILRNDPLSLIHPSVSDKMMLEFAQFVLSDEYEEIMSDGN